ncbi:hypothetical protein [Hymenobacter persicinus]|uniref:DUF4252 domain-containing protein n=1 Tax=Hymenobacter persicinus TaxID=2025506 RepID=A0A4Q5LGH5_9BACT|nr:hypothetical protein [Hymenobacter persicinus]RYU83221.1 hypothetical protein EWM57_02745 [Hymenobacter persicinus]
MKALFLSLLLVCSATFAFGQADKVDFCGQQYAVPADASLLSPYEVKGPDFGLTLLYVNYADFRNGMPAEFLKQRMKKMKSKEMQEITCFIQEAPAKAYKFSYRTETGMAYELLAYGVTKGQPVVIQLVTEIDPYKSAEIPAFARQFVRLEK